MMDHTAQTLTLRDGRTLGYAEWGDPDGKPILLFGGSTSSRLQRPLMTPANSHQVFACIRLTAPVRDSVRASRIARCWIGRMTYAISPARNI
jgi:hypothetical protein